ncbi:MAG: hypothetical protein RL220_188 [Bacteroidota bacterium]
MIFADWFWPGYKAGGPITSLVNLVNALTDIDFLVVTTDRDLHSEQPYEGITANTWVQYREHVRVIYLSPDKLNKAGITDVVREVSADIYYLNSMFSYHFTLVPMMVLRRMSLHGKIILAPRGMLKSGALSVKPWKKKAFLTMARWMGLYKGIEWHATSPEEVNEIRAFAGNGSVIHLAANISLQGAASAPLAKVKGELSVLTVSRVSPEKGIAEAIAAMTHPDLGPLKLRWTIVGAIPDSEYARSCAASTNLSDNQEIIWLGEVPPNEISALMASHHILLSATLGENFGHAIIEALSSGRPAVITDRTPWRGLAASNAGFDLPVGETDKFLEAIKFFGFMDQANYDKWSQGAAKYAADRLGEQDSMAATRRLFGLA